MFKKYLHRNYNSVAAVKYRLDRRVTATGWLLIWSLLVATAFGMDTNISLIYQAFSFLGCLIFLSALLTPLGRPRLAIRRVLPRFGSVGEPIRYRVQIQNHTRRTQNSLGYIEEMPDPRPSFAEFSETPEPGEERRNWLDRTYCYYRWNWLMTLNTRARANESPLPVLPPQTTTTVDMELLPMRRGVLKLSGAVITCPDPFGLFRSLNRVSAPQSILILPRRYFIPRFDLPGALKYQQGGVSMASSVGESEEFVSLRDYRAGDPLRRMHWKSFAKAGRPVVKEFQDEFFTRHALVLDTFSAVPRSEVFEEAVSVAASLACTIQNRDSLLDLMFVGPQAYSFTIGRGLAHLEQMLEVLASVDVCRGASFDTLEKLVLRHASEISGCVCVFLSWDESRQRLVRTLKSLGVPLRVFVVTQTGEPLDPGPMADQPGEFHALAVGKIAEELAKL